MQDVVPDLMSNGKPNVRGESRRCHDCSSHQRTPDFVAGKPVYFLKLEASLYRGGKRVYWKLLEFGNSPNFGLLSAALHLIDQVGRFLLNLPFSRGMNAAHGSTWLRPDEYCSETTRPSSPDALRACSVASEGFLL